MKRRFTLAKPGCTIILMLVLFALSACSSGSGPAPEVQSTPLPTVADPSDSSSGEQEAASDLAPATPAPTEEVQPTESVAGTDETTLRRYRIAPESSEVRFIVDEILMGKEKTVVGVTSQVTGEIWADLSDPTSARIGGIQIDARDFKTDSSRRNTSIQRYVLQSARDEFQYITFSPSAIDGLPAAVTVGESFEVEVSGDLTIRDVTQAETFVVTITVTSEDELAGLGVTTVQRADYDLTIPSVPAVAGVSEDVRLEIDFIARSVE